MFKCLLVHENSYGSISSHSVLSKGSVCRFMQVLTVSKFKSSIFHLKGSCFKVYDDPLFNYQLWWVVYALWWFTRCYRLPMIDSLSLVFSSVYSVVIIHFDKIPCFPIVGETKLQKTQRNRSNKNKLTNIRYSYKVSVLSRHKVSLKRTYSDILLCDAIVMLDFEDWYAKFTY